MAATNNSGFTKPGDPLNLFKANVEKKMIETDQASKSTLHGKVTITSFLYIPIDQSDLGQRPFSSGNKENHSSGITLIDTVGESVTHPIVGGKYKLGCNIRNSGAAASYGGLCDFYIVTKAVLQQSLQNGTRLSAFAHTGFSVMPGLNKIVDCPKTWTPLTLEEAKSTLLIQAYDPFIDPIKKRYDAHIDRHTRRKDLLADFSGTWEGIQKQVGSNYTINCKMQVTQNNFSVNFQYFTLGNYIPNDGHNPSKFPKESLGGLASVINDQINLKIEERDHTVNPQTDYLCTWNIFLNNDVSLHFKCTKHGMNFPDEIIYGDLQKTL